MYTESIRRVGIDQSYVCISNSSDNGYLVRFHGENDVLCLSKKGKEQCYHATFLLWNYIPVHYQENFSLEYRTLHFFMLDDRIVVSDQLYDDDRS